jgi:hypothetical protein
MDDAGTARGAQCGWRTDSGVAYSVVGEMNTIEQYVEKILLRRGREVV